MSDDFDQRLALGKEANRLLNDPLFNGILKTLIKEYLEALVGTAPGSEAGLTAHAGLRSLEDIKQRLNVIRNDGVLAQKELERG